MKRWLVVAGLGLATLGCGEEDDNRADIAGPAIDIHCFNLDRAGVGDANVRVTCPPATAQQRKRGNE